MITLYHAPRTRSMRVLWLLEELQVPYRIESVEFVPPTKPFGQRAPFGKLPAIEDGDVTMFESGAIVEYVLERYGEGRLAPALGSKERAPFLQWIHFAEGTAFPGIGNIAWHVMFKGDADKVPEAIEDYRGWALSSVGVVDQALAGKAYLLGDEFSAADVMMGYTLVVAKWFGILTDAHPNAWAYIARLEERPAFQKALT
jgi:glutathione S-transferase